MRQRIRTAGSAAALGAALSAALVGSVVLAAAGPDHPGAGAVADGFSATGAEDGIPTTGLADSVANTAVTWNRHRAMASYRIRGLHQPTRLHYALYRRHPVVSARTLLRRLTVRTETPKGYQRSKFKLWISQGHGCDTRAVVLKDESSTRTTQNKYCTVDAGKWKSQYDGRTVRHAGELDIDHRVPLDEAWKSGAKKWTTGTRTAYANDLGYAQSLVAVTLHTNRSKGDRDVAEWLPPKSVCHYVTRWIAVKYRWSLTVNKAEASVLRSRLSSCGPAASRVTRPARATVRTTG